MSAEKLAEVLNCTKLFDPDVKASDCFFELAYELEMGANWRDISRMLTDQLKSVGMGQKFLKAGSSNKLKRALGTPPNRCQTGNCEAHHIVAVAAGGLDGDACRLVLINSHIDMNDPTNGAWAEYTFHKSLH